MVQNNVIDMAQTIVSAHPPRINPVEVHKFQKTKLLGQGGQGTVHMGTYEGTPCAGKTFLGRADQRMVNEVLREVQFFMLLDHPHCHYLLGAKTTLENGGILQLTEVCSYGSLFDMYSVKGVCFCVY